jgi:ATP-dependent DNA helicase RecQ
VLLRKLLGPGAAFRAGQWEAIDLLANGRKQALIVQRTGWGKSIVYFLTTRHLRDQGAGPTLVVSPLLALMRNQIESAERLGLRAATINSSNTEEWEEVYRKVLAGSLDLLLVAPERFSNEEFFERFIIPVGQRVGLLVIDEAHCISDWGHDFRPDYQRIRRILQTLPPGVPVAATTATANDRVVNDVVRQLGSKLQVQRGPLRRESLRLQNLVLPSRAERLAWLADRIPSLPGTGIVYVLTVRDAGRVAGFLSSRGIKARAYSGDLEAEERHHLEQALLKNELKALVATTALGMGFDKPDLGFVVHFQRPGSVVHYYQQVGRAGRAIPEARGILLSGTEDAEIIDYFIESAFPPERHVGAVLRALEGSSDGLLKTEVEAVVNLRAAQVEKVLKILSIQSPAPAVKEGSKWFRGPGQYVPDQQKIDALTALRRAEQSRMTEYVTTRSCLMEFLGRELDDPSAGPCGRCANCSPGDVLPDTASPDSIEAAIQYLRSQAIVIEPRKKWMAGALPIYGWKGGMIAADSRVLPGRALSTWGDDVWGALVAQGKHSGLFSDDLVMASANLVRAAWKPAPFPTWVTCVPSLNHPRLVPDFSERLASALRIPFRPALRKVRVTEPQKAMQNSSTQARNLDGAFEVDPAGMLAGPCLLVDDLVDSKWTMTVAGALLRRAGCPCVYPFALADSSRASG